MKRLDTFRKLKGEDVQGQNFDNLNWFVLILFYDQNASLVTELSWENRRLMSGALPIPFFIRLINFMVMSRVQHVGTMGGLILAEGSN